MDIAFQEYLNTRQTKENIFNSETFQEIMRMPITHKNLIELKQNENVFNRIFSYFTNIERSCILMLICDYLYDNQLDDNKKYSEERINNAKLKVTQLRPNIATWNGHCVTIVRRNLFVTNAHHSHVKLTLGTQLGNHGGVNNFPPVKLYNGDEIVCRVTVTSKKLDYVLMQPITPNLPEEIKNLSIEPAFYRKEIIIINMSGLYKIDSSISFDIGNISSDSLDDYGHRKTNKKGSPGAPVFDFYTGALVGMQVGEECSTDLLNLNCDDYGGKAVVIPGNLLLDYLDYSNDDLM